MSSNIYDLRDLVMMINDKKEVKANLALEFDCKIEVEDIKPLIKVINYAINFISNVGIQPMQISLNAGENNYKLVLTASIEVNDFPTINPQVTEALKMYEATISVDGEPAKFIQLIIEF